MRVEPARERELAAALGLDPIGRALDPEVRHGCVRVGDTRGVRLEPAESERHRLGVVEDLCGGAVGEELAAARERKPQQHGRVRREQKADHCGHDHDHASFAPAATPGE